MAEAIRVLHVFGTTNLGGGESRVMDLYRTIDKTRVQFDFLVHTDKECYFDKEIIEMGGRIFRVPPFRVYNIFSYKRAFSKLFRMHPEIIAVHGHMTSTASIYLPIAKKAGVRTTIAHARSAGVDKGIKGKLTKFLRRNLSKKADILFACSELAGPAVFGSRAWNDGEVTFIPDAIDVEKYRYNPIVRQKMREKLQVNNNVVIGHVGSFRYAKNHEYLIRIFSELVKNTNREEMGINPILILLGDGELKESVMRQVDELGLNTCVRFMGNVSDVWDFYQAFDYIVFPSRYEGMPGTIVEAQVAGLRCLISDEISKDTIYTDLVTQKSINVEPAEWVAEILQTLEYERTDRGNDAIEAGFDVTRQMQEMTDFYETGIWK